MLKLNIYVKEKRSLCELQSPKHVHENTGCFKKSFITLKHYTNLFRGHVRCFPLIVSNGHLVPRILHPWIFSYGDSLSITIPTKTRCALLHYKSSKHCMRPLNKFIQAFKVVKIFLKHPVFVQFG
jgi:hypothetical protein